jgi:glycosyltransferase involved in cell wall biosynthesis
MRIALVVPGGVDRSGETRVIPALLALISRLAGHHDLQVFALHQEPRPGEWHLAGAHIRNIGAGRLGKGHTLLRTIGTIRAVHRSMPFDIVHSIWSGWGGLAAAAAGRMLRIPTLIHITGGELVSIPEIRYGGSRKWHGRLRERLTLRAASAVTATSASVVERLSEWGVAAQRVPLGIDLAAWPLREPARRDPGRPARLIHVATLNRVKDQTTLLHALASLAQSGTDFEMDVVGDDILNGEIQRLNGRLGLSNRVRFLGFLTQRRLRPLVEKAHLMILSSRHEAGPFVMLEAAAAGVPTVGTAVGHILEWSPDAAIAVPIGDAPKLAAAIAKILQDEDLRLCIARAAQQRAVREDADYTAACFQALYIKHRR